MGSEDGGYVVVLGGECAVGDVLGVEVDGALGEGVDGGIDGDGSGVGVFYFAVCPEAGEGFDGGGEL